MVVGLFDVQSTAFIFSSIFGIPLMQPNVGYVIAVGSAFGVALAGVLVFGYRAATTRLCPEPTQTRQLQP